MAAVLLLGPVAVALGAVALVRTRRHGTRGRGPALVALVLGGVETLVALVVLVLLVGALVAGRALPTDLDAPREARPQQVVPGHCLRTLPADGAVRRVTLVPCDGPHAGQAVSTYAFPSGAGWPGDEGAAAAVGAACRLSDAERAAGDVAVAWAPTRLGWLLGDRDGLCLVRPSTARR